MKIFSMSQADFLYKQGCHVVGFGYGREGKAYVLFDSNDLFKVKMKEWQEIKRKLRESKQK